MNPSTDSQPAPPPSSAAAAAACPRHPQEHLAPFCPLCLCERLSLVDSSPRKPPSTAASALKSIFRPGSAVLRRTQSFSASKNEPFSALFEPQRKSCDLRLRNTLISHDARILVSAHEIASNLEDRPSSSLTEAQIRVSEIPNSVDVAVIESRVKDIVELEREEEFKPMMDHLDLDSKTKKPSGSFWSAASVFSKKLQKWRDKQNGKKQRNGGGSTTLPVEKRIGRHFGESQTEIADYGFGRRSCDIDPRFSLDAGRMSFDDPRCSIDQPRASWDGYLNSRTFPRIPTMLVVVEDAPINVFRSDARIPVEDCGNSTNEDENIPGGSSQTRDYYFDTSSRRRKSLDRSNSIRKTVAAMVAEIDERKSVTPASIDISQGPKLAIPDRESNSNSLRDDCFGTRNRKEESKKSSWWGKGWSIWGLINRPRGNKDGEEDKETSPNGVERPFSGSWPVLEGYENINVKGGFNPKMLRSNSSVSWRSSSMMGGSFSSSRKSNADSNGDGNGKKKIKELKQPVLERNRSARHSPTNVENGLLRFYFTPMRGSWRDGSAKVKPNQAQSIARSVLRLF